MIHLSSMRRVVAHVSLVHLRSRTLQWSLAIGIALTPTLILLGGPFLNAEDHTKLAIGTSLYTFGLLWAALPTALTPASASWSLWPGSPATKDGVIGVGWATATLGSIILLLVGGGMFGLMMGEWRLMKSEIISLGISAWNFTVLLSAMIFLGSILMGPTTGRFVSLAWLAGGPTCADGLQAIGAPSVVSVALESLARSSPLESAPVSVTRLLATTALASAFALIGMTFHQSEEEKGRKLTSHAI